MNEEENQENQEQQQNENGLAKQVGKEALDQGKRMAGDAAKKAGKEIAKKAIMAVAQVVAAFIQAMLPIILVTVGICAIAGLAKWVIDTITTQKASEQTQAILEEYCEIDDEGIRFNKEALKDNIVKILEEEIGIDVNDLKLATVNTETGEIDEEKASEYLYNFFTASIASELPYIPGSDKEAQGIIKIKRRNANGETKDLEYIEHEKFTQMIDSDDRAERENSKNYFSIDESWNLCVSQSYREIVDGEEQIYTVKEVPIPYRSMVSQYAVPFEFLITLQSITYNAEYVQAVADMISQNSEIELTIFDSVTTTTNTEIYRHSIMRKWIQEIEDDFGEVISSEQKRSEHPEKQPDQVTVKIIEEESMKANITKAKTWVIDQKTLYEREVPDPEYPLDEEGDTVTIEDEKEPPGDEGTWKVNQSQTTIIRIDKSEWVKTGDTQTNIEPDQFLGLWRNSVGTFVKYYNEDGSINPDAQYNSDPDEGIVVRYPLIGQENGEYDRPVMNILSSEDWLCSLLEQNMRTQTHGELMRYLIHFYKTGEKLEIDLSIFNPTEFTDVATIEGGSIQEKVWNALIGAGFSEYAAAGAMGNIHYESGGFNPSAVEGGYTDSTGGIGICQWTNTNRGTTGRNTNLKNYALSKGKTWQDEDIQVQYLLTELTGSGDAVGYASYQLMTTTNSRYGRIWYKYEWEEAEDIETATKAFCYTFERPATGAANSSMATRIELAQRYYNTYHGSGNGDYSGDVVRYYQNDYASVSYGNGTIATSGCGPTAFAMVATHLTGETITPKDAIEWCGNAYYVENQGTSWSYFGAAARYFNLGCTVRQVNSFSEVERALKNGKLVISSQGRGLFTSGGHYILLTGIEDGKIYVNDPNKNNAENKGYNNRGFSKEEITAAAKQYWIFE